VLRLGVEGLAGVQRILCVGAHSDDIEIGCGGTVLALLMAHPGIEVDWIVLSALGDRAIEARRSAERFLSSAVRATIRIQEFRERFFPYIGIEIKDYFDALSKDVQPDLVFCHVKDDRHQDHKLVSELVENTFRDHLILQYEIPKYDGDLRTPNVYVGLTEEVLERKVRYLMQAFPTQTSRYWFTEDVFRGLARIRGIESRAPGGFAEGFHCRKLLLS
jgi:LmbE family N-acetylglucosaminyl deacetylase